MSKVSQEKKRRATQQAAGSAAKTKTSSSSVRKTATAKEECLDLRIEQLLLDPNQPRKKFREGPMQELMASIKSQGLQQPVNVTFAYRRDGVDYYYIKHGERRYHAHVRLNRKTVKCFVLNEVYEAKLCLKRLLQQSAENGAREPQTHCENIRVVSLVVNAEINTAGDGKTHGLIQIALAKVAQAHGKKVAWATNYLTLSRLHPDLQEMLDHEGDEKLNFQVALSLARAPLAEQQKLLVAAKPFFAKNFHVGLKFISTAAREAKVNSGQKVRGRQSDHKDHFLRFGDKLLALCTRFQGVAATNKQWKGYLENMAASMSVLEAEQMARTLAQAMIPFQDAHALLMKKRDDHLREIGAKKN